MRALPLALVLCAQTAAADCFDETLLVSRYHYPNPGTVAQNFQDLYLLDYPALPQTLPQVTRLSSGFVSSPRYDSTDATVMASDGTVVFVSSRLSGYSDLFSMAPVDADQNGEGDGLARHTDDGFERFALHMGPADTLIYVSEEHGYQTAMASFDPATGLGTETVLTSHSGETTDPVLSPDGAHAIIAFEETPYPLRTHSLNHVPTAGGLPTRLIYDGVVNQSPSLSPDAQTLYFTSTRQGGKLDIFSAPLDLTASPPALGPLTNLTQTPDLSELNVKVSPDGACLAFLANDYAATYGPNSDLYIMDLTASMTRRVTSTRDIGSFTWMPAAAPLAPQQASQTTARATKAGPAAVKCHPFDAQEIERRPINGTVAHLFTHRAAPGQPPAERCTSDIPPLTRCALSQVSGGGAASGCAVRPTRGLVNASRWSLLLDNSTGTDSLECTMICATD